MPSPRTRIRRIDVHAVRYTHAAGPFALSGGRVSTGQDGTVVRVETEDGLVGWGEQCVIAPDYGEGHGPLTRAALGLLAPALLGADPRQVEVAYARLDAVAKGLAYAKSALDMACWDLFGKATGLRVADLLGGAYRESLPLYTGVGVAAPDEMRERCREALARGFRQVQLKVGTDWREDVARVEACLEELAGADGVIVDANGYWTQAEAASALARLDGRDLLVEQPCATIEECAALRRASRRPFVLDESLTRVDDLVRARAAGALDAVRLKLARFGGITPVRRARDLAVAFGLPATIEDSGGGDVVTAAVVHLGCTIPPHLLLAGYLPSDMNAERIARGAPSAEEGSARLPEPPGLGVEVDEAALGERVLRVE